MRLKGAWFPAPLVVLLLGIALLLPPLLHGHVTDVCWIWGTNREQVTFYVGTWHPPDQVSECKVYQKLNSKGQVQSCSKGSSGCKLCPLHVQNQDETREYLFEGTQTDVSTSEVQEWTCRGFCPATYKNGTHCHSEYRYGPHCMW
ncbi:hypothetical protein CYMTET_29810 [Cymbomonas tetramitiformis]|uniref:Uncharacterized protein n=1 Tax=Cymbomonas tetramitiformis TaxID=36881 RepID=A0AAE0FK19_9CHLO|nr:hypothetical protein CYMTET_29810 [Cymbomonas tetramitiformis]